MGHRHLQSPQWSDFSPLGSEEPPLTAGNVARGVLDLHPTKGRKALVVGAAVATLAAGAAGAATGAIGSGLSATAGVLGTALPVITSKEGRAMLKEDVTGIVRDLRGPKPPKRVGRL